MNHVLRSWGPACAYAAVIFYLSSLPHPEKHLPLVTHFSDKVLHAVEYAVLGALCYRALRVSRHESWRRRAIPFAILFASVYGISDEVHQFFVPFRESSWLDWVADTVGGLVGTMVMHQVLGLKSVKTSPGVLPSTD